MSILLSVDGGLRGCGVALFEGQELARAAYVLNPEHTARGVNAWLAMAKAVRGWALPVPVDVLAVEEMQVDGRTRGKEADVMQVNAVVAAVAARVPATIVMGYTPTAWKGSVDGDVMVERIKGRLTPEELARLEPCSKSLAHNMYDGIGVGLHFLGRLTPRRVIHR
jgi:hypothetical protein